MILVSACLAGINCKYNGGNNYNEEIFEMVKRGEAIPVCAEQLGGLTTPRTPAEIRIIDGKKHVINRDGKESPSCGVGKIYSGNFDGEIIDGNGILEEMLMENGVEVESR